MTTASRVLAALAPVALLVGCGPESDRSIAGAILASHTSSFSPWSEPVSLGSTINTSFNDQQPALSKDGLSLYFASNRPEGPDDATFDLDIWLSRRACADDSCPWETPVLLGTAVNSPSNESGPALSRDGHQLFFFSNRTVPGSFGAADIWVSRRDNVHDDFAWGAPENLGPGVNTNQVDGGPGYFENEEGGAPQLYFNRSATAVVGGDIYVSELAADGSFGGAVPVSELNSDATDQRPSISSSGLDIYFHSDRPGSNSMDIWVSTRESVLEPWSPPTNLGSPINTAAGEFLPFIFSHGGIERLYFTRNIATPPAVNLDVYVSTRSRGTP
jgi:hypothetical protein